MVEPISKHTLRKMAEYGERGNLARAMEAAGISPMREAYQMQKLTDQSECICYACFEAGKKMGMKSDQALVNEMASKYGEGVRQAVTEVVAAWRASFEKDSGESFGQGVGLFSEEIDAIRRAIEENTKRKEEDDAVRQ